MAKQLTDKEVDDIMALAVSEIYKSEALRFFIRQILIETGVTTTPFDLRAAGRHEIGVTLISYLTRHNKLLYPELLVQEQESDTSETEGMDE